MNAIEISTIDLRATTEGYSDKQLVAACEMVAREIGVNLTMDSNRLEDWFEDEDDRVRWEYALEAALNTSYEAHKP